MMWLKSIYEPRFLLTDTGEDSKLVNRRKRSKVDTLFSSLFFDASERRVWLSAKSKILASTFGRFRLYRLMKSWIWHKMSMTVKAVARSQPEFIIIKVQLTIFPTNLFAQYDERYWNFDNLRRESETEKFLDYRVRSDRTKLRQMWQKCHLSHLVVKIGSKCAFECEIE